MPTPQVTLVSGLDESTLQEVEAKLGVAVIDKLSAMKTLVPTIQKLLGLSGPD